jgi:hypothetical protein
MTTTPYKVGDLVHWDDPVEDAGIITEVRDEHRIVVKWFRNPEDSFDRERAPRVYDMRQLPWRTNLRVVSKG